MTACSVLLISSSIAQADVKVIASIKPIHSLVASVMEGVGTPQLLLEGNASPHTYTLKPNDATALEQAQVIFWVGHELEAFLEKPLDVLSTNATVVGLLKSDGLKILEVRENEEFEQDDHEGEHHDAADAHVWLDPENAKAMLQTIAQTLSQADVVNAEVYADNAAKAASKLDVLTSELNAQLAPVKSQNFIVFHDAYQYFETRFSLKASGAISIHPENPPGAKQIAAIQNRIKSNSIQCVFSEPQFDSKLVEVIMEGTSAKSATLDPIGAAIDAGPKQYETLMRNLAENLRGCLGAS